MKSGPGVSCADYLPVRQCERGKQLVDEALAGEGRRLETWQRQVCGRKEAKASMSEWQGCL